MNESKCHKGEQRCNTSSIGSVYFSWCRSIKLCSVRPNTILNMSLGAFAIHQYHSFVNVVKSWTLLPPRRLINWEVWVTSALLGYSLLSRCWPLSDWFVQVILPLRSCSGILFLLWPEYEEIIREESRGVRWFSTDLTFQPMCFLCQHNATETDIYLYVFCVMWHFDLSRWRTHEYVWFFIVLCFVV